jgi:hypothetical protein
LKKLNFLLDRAPQKSGPELENQKFISAAPGVAYEIAGHLFPLLNWTEVGRKFVPQRLTNGGPRSSPQRVAGMARRAYADPSGHERENEYLGDVIEAFATLRLTAETIENLSALSGVACKKIEAILPSLAAPNPAPKTVPLLSVALPCVTMRKYELTHGD